MSESDSVVFTHRPSLYLSRVYGEGAIGAAVALFSAERLINGGELLSLWLIPLIVGGYAAVRLLVTGSVPRQIEIHSDQVVFTQPRRIRTFAMSDVTEFRLREFTSSATCYIRIKTRVGREQKYWIEWRAYSDGEALRDGIRGIDHRLNPGSLKAVAGIRGYTNAKGAAHDV